jgi:MoaA/NifB/PqqE/SkfB family radical SAM enzyme
MKSMLRPDTHIGNPHVIVGRRPGEPLVNLQKRWRRKAMYLARVQDKGPATKSEDARFLGWAKSFTKGKAAVVRVMGNVPGASTLRGCGEEAKSPETFGGTPQFTVFRRLRHLSLRNDRGCKSEQSDPAGDRGVARLPHRAFERVRYKPEDGSEQEQRGREKPIVFQRCRVAEAWCQGVSAISGWVLHHVQAILSGGHSNLASERLAKSAADFGDLRAMEAVKHLNLEMTNLCNQKCSYCFNGSGPERRRGELDLEVWYGFLSVQRDLGLESVHLTGGEPFVDSRAIPLLKAAQALGLKTSVLSNGYRVERLVGMYGSIFQGLAVVQISLDSPTAAVHDARRGKQGAWRQAISAIRALRRAEIACEISCTVSSENVDDVLRLAGFCHRRGLRLIVRRMTGMGRALATALQPVWADRLNAVLADVEQRYPSVLVQDRFCYVPNGAGFDEETRRKGIVTVLPDGRFRSGRVTFPKMTKPFASVSEMLAAA